MAALLGLFWRLLPEGRLKGEGEGGSPMEHASRGRRSGNKGVGARWRGTLFQDQGQDAENSGIDDFFNSAQHRDLP